MLEARGLVLDALGERPRLAQLTVAAPGPGEVRVRMRAAGLCHTDVSQVRDALACQAATVVPLADYELLTDLGATGDHAGVWETSLLLPVRPDLVHLEAEGDSRA